MPLLEPTDQSFLARATVEWFAQNRRDLPWRVPGTTPWGILVSEIMLQQTPVARVEPRWLAWVARWPTAPDLAAEALDQALRMWGRLGYPRRARSLHSAAQLITSHHGGEVPASRDELLALPGIGDYTAAAVQAFAFGLASNVLDTNVRRVLARFLAGKALPAASITKSERACAQTIIDGCQDQQPPIDPANWSAAVMELGALVCTSRAPACSRCPLAARCSWLLSGAPAGVRSRQAPYAGSQREVRGRILAALRDAPAHDQGPAAIDIDHCWPDEMQRQRAINSLVSDGLIENELGSFRLARS